MYIYTSMYPINLSFYILRIQEIDLYWCINYHKFCSKHCPHKMLDFWAHVMIAGTNDFSPIHLRWFLTSELYAYFCACYADHFLSVCSLHLMDGNHSPTACPFCVLLILFLKRWHAEWVSYNCVTLQVAWVTSCDGYNYTWTITCPWKMCWMNPPRTKAFVQAYVYHPVVKHHSCQRNRIQFGYRQYRYLFAGSRWVVGAGHKTSSVGQSKPRVSGTSRR